MFGIVIDGQLETTLMVVWTIVLGIVVGGCLELSLLVMNGR